MTSQGAAYSGKPTRNPLRFLLAVWRASRDVGATDEVAIVQIGFSRSRLGRRFARWDRVADELSRDPRCAALLARPFGPLDLAALGALPEGTLGRVFADHCRERGLDPNLVGIDGDRPEDRLLRRLYATHDVWHVVTGWGNDEPGEVGLGGFYLAQLEAPFFLFLLSLVFLNTVFAAPTTLRERMDALVAGYQAGRRAQPLFAADWESQWRMPLAELRASLDLEGTTIVGQGIPEAA